MATGRFPRSSGRTYWAVVVFLVSFFALLIFVVFYFIRPAGAAATAVDIEPRQRHALAAYSWLILSLLLVVLICGLILTFRVGRFFFPRPTAPRTRTRHVDVWAESARRMPTPPPDDELP